MRRTFRFVDRWQNSLAAMFPNREGDLKLMEDRDRQLEHFLDEVLQDTDWGAVDPPCVRACQVGAAQSIANNTTPVIVSLDTTHYDRVPNVPRGVHHSAGRLTIQPGYDGLYEIGTAGAFAANAAGIRDVSIYLNGTTVLATARELTPSATKTVRLSCSTPWRLVAGDYIEQGVFQDSGAALNTAVLAPAFPALWLRRVAA